MSWPVITLIYFSSIYLPQSWSGTLRRYIGKICETHFHHFLMVHFPLPGQGRKQRPGHLELWTSLSCSGSQQLTLRIVCLKRTRNTCPWRGIGKAKITCLDCQKLDHPRMMTAGTPLKAIRVSSVNRLEHDCERCFIFVLVPHAASREGTWGNYDFPKKSTASKTSRLRAPGNRWTKPLWWGALAKKLGAYAQLKLSWSNI